MLFQLILYKSAFLYGLKMDFSKFKKLKYPVKIMQLFAINLTLFRLFVLLI